MRQVFLDTETTGLDPNNGDRIVEIGCIEMIGRRLTGRTLHRYVNPERASHPDALRVHGLSEEFLAQHPKFAEVAQEVVDFVRGAELLIHNASFDLGFLDAELARSGHAATRTHAAKVTDTLLLARETYPGKANSLDALCKRLEVDNSHRELHGALLDAGLLAEVYIRLTRGQDSLVIDAVDGSPAARQHVTVDLSRFVLPIVSASADEVQAHAAVLAEVDRASGGRAIWRAADADAQKT